MIEFWNPMKAKRTIAVALAFLLVGIGVAVVAWPRDKYSQVCELRKTSSAKASDFAKATQARIAQLKERIGQEKVVAEDAVKRYTPTIAGRIDDPNADAIGVLRGLPFVAAVDVALRARRPSCRIVQVCDWHFVDPELFRTEVSAILKRTLTAEEGELLYQEHLLQVELVQVQQTALLRCLAKHHGLKAVYIERLTAEVVPEFKTRIAALKEADPHQDELRRQLAEVQGLLKKLTDEGQAASATRRRRPSRKRLWNCWSTTGWNYWNSGLWPACW
jgi:hypothetical protein